MTLAAWKFANGIPTNTTIPASTTNFMNGIVAATYFNSLDLGFGRRMIMKGTNGGNWAFSVSNYKTVDDAINDTNKIATVTMDYSAVPPGTAKFTKFYVYDTNDARVNFADLDGGGKKFVPGLCIVCHGGTSGTVPSDGNVHAHFLAFDLQGLDYSCNSNFSRSAQEPAFKLLNKAVLAIEQDIAQNDSTHVAPTITNLIQGWYGPGLTNSAQNDFFVPSAWQKVGDSLSLAGQAYLYRNVVATSCRSCHETRDTSRNLDFGSYTNFVFWCQGGPNSVVKADVYGTNDIIAQIVNGPIFMDPNDPISMPQARRMFQRFWNSISPRAEPDILISFLLGSLDHVVPPPTITSVNKIGNDVSINFTTLSGGSYSLESANDLTHPTWTPVTGTISGNGSVVQVIEPMATGQSKGFYRVVVMEP